MASTMASATVGTVATVESSVAAAAIPSITATMESSVAPTVISTAGVAMPRPAITRPAISVSGPISPARASIVAVPVIPAAVVGRTPVRVIPRPDTHEHAASKIARAPIAVRCACIGIIRVVAIRADRFRPDGRVHRPDAHPHRNLRLCARGREEQNSQQSCKF